MTVHIAASVKIIPVDTDVFILISVVYIMKTSYTFL